MSVAAFFFFNMQETIVIHTITFSAEINLVCIDVFHKNSMTQFPRLENVLKILFLR